MEILSHLQIQRLLGTIFDREKKTFSLWIIPMESGRLTLRIPTGPFESARQRRVPQSARASKQKVLISQPFDIKKTLPTCTDLKFALVLCQMIGFILKILLTNLRREPEAHLSIREEASDWQLKASAQCYLRRTCRVHVRELCLSSLSFT